MNKIAVIGTGIIGLSHLEAIVATDVFELCAVCDINEEKAKECAEKYQVPYFTDYKEIPEKTDADAVIINLPHFLHCECSIFFLEKGLHVLVEKPMANSAEECDRMIAAAKKSGKALLVGHVQRYNQANAYVKDAIDDGRYGKLCMIAGKRSINYFLESRPKWFLNKKAAGGGIGMNYGAHAMDTLYYIVGEEACEICSSFGNFKNEEEIEGHMQFFLKFPSGLSMSETLDGYMNCGHDMVYYFTDAVVKVDNASRLFQLEGGEWKEIPLGEEQKPMERQLIDFCNYLEGKETMICTAEEGRRVIAALDKIYQRS